MRDQKAIEYDGVVSPLRDEPSAFKRQCFRDGWDAAIAALPDMVQPLVFENRQSNNGLINYRIHIGYGLMNGIFALTCNGSTIGEFGSEAEAEKFADTHNRNRILSAFGITGET